MKRRAWVYQRAEHVRKFGARPEHPITPQSMCNVAESLVKLERGGVDPIDRGVLRTVPPEVS
jgi:hypothetical protein